MAIKKVKLPNNTTVDVNDSRISSTDITNWNAKQKAITVSSSEPTSSQGSDGDIWIVI